MLKSWALRLVKTSAAAVDHLRVPSRGVILLLYHRVGGDSGLQVDLPVDAFRLQMEILAEQGRATTLDDALATLPAAEPPPRDPVVVTFDDGTADFAEVALPILNRFAIPVTLYLATDFIERRLNFPHQGRPLSWSSLRDALSTGLVKVGSHTHTHRLLDRIPAGLVEEELDRSRGLIEDRLQVAATHFAYPKAVLGSPAADAAVRQRFQSAALAGNRANGYGRTDPYRLARSAIQITDGVPWFRRKLGGGMALEESLRRMLNRYRHAGLST